MKLVIAEKPSVAKSIATVIGATEKKDGYFEGNNYLVSWCVGHLVELAMPVAYGEQYKHWNAEDLPLIPEKFLYRISSKTGAQFKILRDLMQRSDVDTLIEATDAGREGELIFRLVYNQARCRKPFQRLWISSMEDSAIRDGMANLRPSAEYDNLYHAAMARQKADWLVGINASRLYTSLYHRKLSVGRVQTPTLQLIVQRWRQHNDFQPTPYYRLSIDVGGWHLYHGLTVADCEKDVVAAQSIAQRTKSVKIVSIDQDKKKENAPALYDLTSLQRDANRLLGYTAKQTLDYLQSLYDKKLATYPRTDSRYLTHDMEMSTQQLLTQLLQVDYFAAIKAAADPASWNVTQVINDKKVSDHHAIIPTKEVTAEKVAELPTGERNILALITTRLFTSVAAPHLYMATKITAMDESTSTLWAATGREDLQQGFITLSGALRSLLELPMSDRKKKENLSEKFPSLEKGQVLFVQSVNVEEKKTTPPSLYTEDTLLAAMETAGKDLDDPALREAMKGSGLGTPATRAAIIENIIKTGYVERVKKSLTPTQTGLMLIDMIDPELKSPELTGQWECLLTQIAAGSVSADAFLTEISALTTATINRGKAAYSEKTAQKFQEAEILGYCPLCGRPVKENRKAYGCTGYRDDSCKWAIWKTIAGKSISVKTAGQLINNHRSSLLKGFTSKSGKKFDAYLILEDDGNVGFDFPAR